MIKNYLLTAVRNLWKYRGYSLINIVGLAVGMAVTLLIGLWIWNELHFNQYHKNYDRIAQVWQHNTYNGIKTSGVANPYLMAEQLRNSYWSDFKYALQSSWNLPRTLSTDEKVLNRSGMFWEPQVIDLLSLQLLPGSSKKALSDPRSILLSATVAKALFGNVDPVNQTIRINNDSYVQVTGVYEDLPHNSAFHEMHWIMPWQLYINDSDFIKNMTEPWTHDFTQTWVQVADNTRMEEVSAKITDIKYIQLEPEKGEQSRPEVFLHPMSKWHLFSEFRNGHNTGGRIEFVWLFGIIGAFVLLLACVNFMNLSTARSEKRAKEVGIRKSIGSLRSQLIIQFFMEYLLVVLLALALALLFVQLMLPYFNQIADKTLALPWQMPSFWIAGIGFTIFTAVIAGSYPALYLSSFRPVKVLKGTFQAGKNASLLRKVLVVFQSVVSVLLIIGTIIVFKQIDYAKKRPIGYDRDGLINIPQITTGIHDHFDAIRQELLGSRTILGMAESHSPLTRVWNSSEGFDWQGKDPSLAVSFPNNGVTYEYGKTVGWSFKEGRDFSPDFGTDSLAFVINEAAAHFLGFKNPIGKALKWNEKTYIIIGVINNMVIESPYMPIRPQLYHIDESRGNVVILKLNPARSTRESLDKIKAVIAKYNPISPFEYQFVDQDYARKFEGEVRIGKLASFFALMAILISCLGIFGLAGYLAEQRTKEIGIRKVLGASVFNIWSMLSREFVILVAISLIIAMPVAYYLMDHWLAKYAYRTEISWWIFAVEGGLALLITILTVSYQSIKAATANPVKSLKT